MGRKRLDSVDRYNNDQTNHNSKERLKYGYFSIRNDIADQIDEIKKNTGWNNNIIIAKFIKLLEEPENKERFYDFNYK